MLLSVLIGTGLQLFAMLIVTFIIGTVGFLQPYQRGGLLTMMLLLFVLMGGFAGYWSAKIYKMFNHTDWLKTALVTAVLFPSLAFAIFFFVNFFLSLEDSLGAVPFSTILALLLLWLGCSSPLVLIGAFIGIKKKPIKNPCKVNPVPSSIPQQPWYLETKIITLISGILPFGYLIY